MCAEAEETAEHLASNRIAQTDGGTQTHGLNVRGGGGDVKNKYRSNESGLAIKRQYYGSP
jgi:hypothetical protein